MSRKLAIVLLLLLGVQLGVILWSYQDKSNRTELEKLMDNTPFEC